MNVFPVTDKDGAGSTQLERGTIEGGHFLVRHVEKEMDVHGNTQMGLAPSGALHFHGPRKQNVVL